MPNLRQVIEQLDRFEEGPLRASLGHRLLAGLLAIACAALLGLAAWLQPDPRGFGTHNQLRLAPCLWVERVGMPCPTCGMTTAFAHAADGSFLSAARAQPMGLVLAFMTAMTFWVALYVAATGSLIGALLLRLWRPSVLWTAGGLALASWLYKIWDFTRENSLL
ncbi:MAG: DUF2752 domain-containing protein [Phycisphaerales bacterium]